MSVALALIAMLIELCLGYPQWLVRMIGHPVTWIGALIAALDRLFNPPPFPPPLAGEGREGARARQGHSLASDRYRHCRIGRIFAAA